MHYIYSLDDVSAADLDGFCVGWEHPLSGERLLHVLRSSYRVIVARDETTGPAVGFIQAISDGVLSAYLPLLEVRPKFQGQGIGSELVKRMLAELDGLYMVDLCCDEGLVPFMNETPWCQFAGWLVGTTMHSTTGNVHS